MSYRFLPSTKVQTGGCLRGASAIEPQSPKAHDGVRVLAALDRRPPPRLDLTAYWDVRTSSNHVGPFVPERLRRTATATATIRGVDVGWTIRKDEPLRHVGELLRCRRVSAPARFRTRWANVAWTSNDPGSPLARLRPAPGCDQRGLGSRGGPMIAGPSLVREHRRQRALQHRQQHAYADRIYNEITLANIELQPSAKSARGTAVDGEPRPQRRRAASSSAPPSSRRLRCGC